MAAAALSAFDVRTVLLSNDLGDDANGARVRAWLRRHRVASAARAEPGRSTPQIVVIADDRGTRTWFASLPDVAGNLAALDLAPLLAASFAYVDCYQLIEAPAVRAIHLAREFEVPLLVNLGGSPLTIADAMRGHPHLFIQTNVDDDELAAAPSLARSLLTATNAAWVGVTTVTSSIQPSRPALVAVAAKMAAGTCSRKRKTARPGSAPSSLVSVVLPTAGGPTTDTKVSNIGGVHLLQRDASADSQLASRAFRISTGASRVALQEHGASLSRVRLVGPDRQPGRSHAVALQSRSIARSGRCPRWAMLLQA